MRKVVLEKVITVSNSLRSSSVKYSEFKLPGASLSFCLDLPISYRSLKIVILEASAKSSKELEERHRL